MDAEERIKFVVGDVLTKEERRAEGTSQRQRLLDAVRRNELYILTVCFSFSLNMFIISIIRKTRQNSFLTKIRNFRTV